ncbi:MAG: hypothetical protein M3Q36_03650 [bacterium]|nr:hypothetical protein [bacterium]
MKTDASLPNFELPNPQPSVETGKDKSGNEISAAQPELSSIPSAPPAQPILPPPPHPIFSKTSDSSSSHPGSNSATSQLQADDNDLIEKEWVSKAKQIISSTKVDPFMQNREMSRIKADYLKKRYNKDIKLEET